MFEDKILETINKYNMVSKGDKIVVAVSGGPDSMALLNSLINLKDKLEYINDIIKIYLDEPNQLNNITRLIASKSLLDIIMNYETEEEELKDNLNSKCTNYIQNNKTILKSLGLSEDDLISKKIDEITKTTTGNLKLYAKWTENAPKYSIAYE